MIVYLYDYLVWYHLYVVYVLETTFSERIRHFRSKPVPVSPRRQRRSVVSICSRLLAIGVVLSLYAIVGYAIVTVV